MRSLAAVMLLLSCAPDSSIGTTTTTTFTPTTSGDVPEPTLVTSTGSVDTVDTTGTGTTSTTGSTSGQHPTTTGILPDFGPDGPDCGGKIDILFAFDTTRYLDEHYPKLEFALQETLPTFIEWFVNFDTHWLVANTRAGWGIVGCEDECANNDGVMCWPVGPPAYPCKAYDGELSECDTTFAAGVTYPAGFDAANERCVLGSGKRFATSEDAEDLLAELECITQTGWTDVDGLKAEKAMVDAVRPTMTKVPGGCNLGFLRDEALLLVIYFSDFGGVNAPSGPPDQWAQAFLDAKGGDPDKIVVLGISPDTTHPDPVCEKNTLKDDYWAYNEQFLHFIMKHAIHGSRCAEDYRPFLMDVLTLSLALCGEDPPT